MIVGNPASGRIILAARRAYTKAGESVHGQLPYWRATQNDPGKAAFWHDTLSECGVKRTTAYHIVSDLERASCSW